MDSCVNFNARMYHITTPSKFLMIGRIDGSCLLDCEQSNTGRCRRIVMPGTSNNIGDVHESSGQPRIANDQLLYTPTGNEGYTGFYQETAHT